MEVAKTYYALPPEYIGQKSACVGMRATAKAIWPKPSDCTLSKASFLVLYRSIFDVMRELQTEATRRIGTVPGALSQTDLLIIGDMELKTLPAKAGEILLEISLRRYENRSTIITSNRSIAPLRTLYCTLKTLYLGRARKNRANTEGTGLT
jgi:hypothetical protein